MLLSENSPAQLESVHFDQVKVKNKNLHSLQAYCQREDDCNAKWEHSGKCKPSAYWKNIHEVWQAGIAHLAHS